MLEAEEELGALARWLRSNPLVVVPIIVAEIQLNARAGIFRRGEVLGRAIVGIIFNLGMHVAKGLRRRESGMLSENPPHPRFVRPAIWDDLLAEQSPLDRPRISTIFVKGPVIRHRFGQERDLFGSGGAGDGPLAIWPGRMLDPRRRVTIARVRA